VQGFLDLKVDEKMDLMFNIEIKQERVKQWRSFFKSETTNEDFHEEYKSSLSKELLKSLNNELVKGIRVPFSHTQKPRAFEHKPEVGFKKNMIVLTQ